MSIKYSLLWSDKDKKGYILILHSCMFVSWKMYLETWHFPNACLYMCLQQNLIRKCIYFRMNKDLVCLSWMRYVHMCSNKQCLLVLYDYYYAKTNLNSNDMHFVCLFMAKRDIIVKFWARYLFECTWKGMCMYVCARVCILGLKGLVFSCCYDRDTGNLLQKPKIFVNTLWRINVQTKCKWMAYLVLSYGCVCVLMNILYMNKRGV